MTHRRDRCQDEEEVWDEGSSVVLDRGVVSEDNLQDLRQLGAYYLVGTPRRKLAEFERELLAGDWRRAVQRVCHSDQVPVGVVDVLGHPAKTIPKACLIELVVGHRWRQGKSFSRACLDRHTSR